MILADTNKKTDGYTPRELVKHHMEHPEEPITDADIENLVLEVPVREMAEERYEAFIHEREDAGGKDDGSGTHYELPSVY